MQVYIRGDAVMLLSLCVCVSLHVGVHFPDEARCKRTHTGGGHVKHERIRSVI